MCSIVDLSIICPTYRTDKQYDVQLNSSGEAVWFLNGRKYIRRNGFIRRRDQVIQFSCNDYKNQTNVGLKITFNIIIIINIISFYTNTNKPQNISN